MLFTKTRTIICFIEFSKINILSAKLISLIYSSAPVQFCINIFFILIDSNISQIAYLSIGTSKSDFVERKRYLSAFNAALS